MAKAVFYETEFQSGRHIENNSMEFPGGHMIKEIFDGENQISMELY